jgi:5-methyltetrahydropteroyltriglutamate--homocysteine methyltransferase
MKAAGIDHIPSNDFSLYDHMLDMVVMVGAVPARYRGIVSPLTRYFAMARGSQDQDNGIDDDDRFVPAACLFPVVLKSSPQANGA